MQTLLLAAPGYPELDRYFRAANIRKLLLVCGNSLKKLALSQYFGTLEARLGIPVVYFSDFQPNPRYESVEAGVELLRREGCDGIAAVGGGSAIDVAKCIKLFSGMTPGSFYLEQPIEPNNLPFLAVPTTAGTGSEATRFAVIYYKGEKQSVSHVSSIPTAVLFDPDVLQTLPLYQKKATMLDALCHAVESMWSVNATEESQQLSSQAIRAILAAWEGYLANTPAGNAAMLRAANLAGQAIDHTQTTAGHAMCYKLTSLYGISHGHAAALCLTRLYPYMLAHTGDCIDPRGERYLSATFQALALAFGCEEPSQAAWKFHTLYSSLQLPTPRIREEDLPLLCSSVNPQRLKNNPVALSAQTIESLYRSMCQTNEEGENHER